MSKNIEEHSSRKTYKYLGTITTASVVLIIISDVTAGKIVQLSIFPVSVAVLYYPLTLVLADIVTEVYGYAQARRVLWNLIFFSILSAFIFQIAVYMPPVSGFPDNYAFTRVLGQVPRIVVGGLMALFSGQILNDFILAKIKVITKGKFLWIRTISSTIVGQLVDAVVFYVVALYGVIPTNLLIQAIFASWFLKVLLEVIMTPITYLAVNTLKKKENEDYYDMNTDFNPFILGKTRKK